VDPGGLTTPAGEFGPWLLGMQAALRGEADADVPCGACTVCCRSRQFVHVEPDDQRALRAIAPELLFPAPGLPPGHYVLGYDEHGACPMLVDDACSIYADRPRACRAFDCRLFVAVDRLDAAAPAIADRARQWRFTYADDADREQSAAIRAAGRIDPASG